MSKTSLSDTSLSETTGHCLCGAITYAFDATHVTWRGHCHCESCRRNCSAPFTTFFGVTDGHWRWTGVAPALFASSPGVERRFCATCGTPMAFCADHSPGEMHFYAASLSDPSSFRPEFHTFWQERLPWIHLSDDLPRRHGDRD
jgi:hypothetical protein